MSSCSWRAHESYKLTSKNAQLLLQSQILGFDIQSCAIISISTSVGKGLSWDWLKCQFSGHVGAHLCQKLGKQVSYLVMSDATKMAAVGEQWLNRCRKLHITWWTLETTATCRSLFYTTASESSENCSSPGLCNANIHIHNVLLRARKHSKLRIFPLISPASAVYALFVPEYQRMKESIPCISLWFHIWSCSPLWRNRPPRSSSNIWHAHGLTQARPHDAMHLSSYVLT